MPLWGTRMGTTIRALATIAVTAPMAWAGPPLLPPDPYIFDRVPTAQELRLDEGGEPNRFLPALSISDDGAFVAYARSQAVDVWAVPSGRRTVALKFPADTTREIPLIQAVMSGNPCRLVVARTRQGPQTPLRQTVEIAACNTGATLARIDLKVPDDHVIEELVAVPGCALAVVRSGPHVAVVDVEAGKLQPKLAKLFDAPARTHLEWRFARRVGAACKLHAALVDSNLSDRIGPVKFYEFDLRTAKVEHVGMSAYQKQGGSDAKIATTLFAVAPSGKTAALFIQRSPNIIKDLVVVGLGPNGQERVFPMRDRTRMITSMRFIGENDLVFDASSPWPPLPVANVTIMNTATGGTHTICHAEFSMRRKAMNSWFPRATDVNAQLGLFAAALETNVRLYRYRHDPTQRYAGAFTCPPD